MANATYFIHQRPEILALVKLPIRKALDIGCGAAHFSAALKAKSGAEVWGVEPVATAAAEAEQKLDKVLVGVYEAVADELPLAHFDAIFFNDVLEHMTDPYTVLGQVGKHLDANGRLYASIPNVLFIESMLEVLKTRDWRYRDAGILDATHFRFFTRKSIIRMFNEAGWEIEAIHPLNAVNSWKWRLANKLTGGYFTDFLPMQFGVIARKK